MMFNAISDTPQPVQAKLDRICTLAAVDPQAPEVKMGMTEFQRIAAELTTALSKESEPLTRSAGNIVADGFLAAAAICGRLQNP